MTHAQRVDCDFAAATAIRGVPEVEYAKTFQGEGMDPV